MDETPTTSCNRPALAASAQSRDEILAAERRRQTALVAVDLAALDALFADDLIHVHSTGLVHNKGELLQHIERKRGFVAIERGPLTIRIEGTLAVLTGRMTSRMQAGADGSEVLMDSFVTQVLRQSEEGWKFISFQLTLNRET